jgi:hypothetical protein
VALELLVRLGFGPDTVLMNDPKLFVDGRFLSSLLVELEGELGHADSALALFQIGLLHGLRDAARLCHRLDRADARRAIPPSPEATSLVMDWRRREDDGGSPKGISIAGSWPEQHEARARMARLAAPDQPSCWLSSGYTTGWLRGLLDEDVIACETTCATRGAEVCRFEVKPISACDDGTAPMTRRLLAQVPFDDFHQIAASTPVGSPAQPPVQAQTARVGELDRSQPVVHIWGPVMVLPFTTLDEALGTVDMLGRDPGIHEIRAVVIDLREQPLDEGFGAAALEQILETVESWQAQSLITGIGPAAEAAIASLEASHLLLRKDLSEAIATAFQIADAQRHRL